MSAYRHVSVGMKIVLIICAIVAVMIAGQLVLIHHRHVTRGELCYSGFPFAFAIMLGSTGAKVLVRILFDTEITSLFFI
jgi:hypothetical protein